MTLDLQVLYDSNGWLTLFPFIVVLEDGGSIATTESALLDLESVIDEAIATDYSVVILNEMICRVNWIETAAVKGIANASYDISTIVAKWCQRLKDQYMIENRNPPELILGVSYRTSDDGVDITIGGQIRYTYAITSDTFRG
jgi:hypothetical protein